MPCLAPLDEGVGLLLDRGVEPDVAFDDLLRLLVVGGAAWIGAVVLAHLEAGVVPHELDAPGRELTPERVVDPLQGVDDGRPGLDRGHLEDLAADAPPPGVRLGEWADGDAGQAAAVVIGHVRADLVAGQPVDLVLLDAVVDDLRAERDAVRRAVVGALAADLAEVLDAQVDRAVRDQWHVGQDRVRHVDAGAEPLGDHHAVAAKLAEAGGQASALRVHGTTDRRVPHLLDVPFERLHHHRVLHRRVVVRHVADVMTVRLEGVMIPGDRRLDHEREPLRQRVRRHRLVLVVRLAVLDVARAGRVHEGRVGGRDADEVRAEVLRHLLDVLRERLRVDDVRLLRVDDALGRRIGVRRQEVTLIGGVATVRGAHQRILGHRLGVPVIHRLAELAADVLGVRAVVDVDVGDHAHHGDRAAEVRHGPRRPVRRDQRRTDVRRDAIGLVDGGRLCLLGLARAPGEDALVDRRRRRPGGRLLLLRLGAVHPLDRLCHSGLPSGASARLRDRCRD